MICYIFLNRYFHIYILKFPKTETSFTMQNCLATTQTDTNSLIKANQNLLWVSLMNTEQTNHFYVLNCSNNDKNISPLCGCNLWICHTNSNTHFCKPCWCSVQTNEMFYNQFNEIKLVDLSILFSSSWWGYVSRQWKKN